MPFCTECGQGLLQGAQFCTECGTSAFQAEPAQRPGKMNYYEAFNSFDRDGSGTLTADELVGILTRPQGGQAMSQADARAFVAYFDVDGNGALDYDEFCTAMGQPSALGTWQIPAVLPEGPVDAVKFMSTRSLLKALKDVGGHVQVPLERSALEAKYRQTFVEGEPAQQQALETLMGQLERGQGSPETPPGRYPPAPTVPVCREYVRPPDR
jgi:hypothetical protein